MKAFAALESGKGRLVDIPVPEPRDDEALVKIEACVICNTTDWMVLNHHFAAPDFPVIVGHESFGRVVKIGKNVKQLKVGDRVMRPNAIIDRYNGEYHSAWGGFAEYGLVKDQEAIPEFGDLSIENAGLVISLSEIASCLFNFHPLEGKDVLVAGTGIAGLAFVYFAKKNGARKVICTGRHLERLELAKKLGADEIFIDGSEELKQRMMQGPDVDYVIEATGNCNVFKDGIPLLKENGMLAFYGVPEKPYCIENKSPKTYEKYYFEPKEESAYKYVSNLLEEDSTLSSLLMTHKWKFEEIREAFDLVRKGEVVKGIVIID